MRHALSVALQDFEGAMVIISHDRYMLRTVADQFLVIADRRVQPYSGDLDDYSRWIAEQNRERERRELAEKGLDGEATVRATAVESATDRKQRKRMEAEQRQRLAPLRAQLKSLEAKMEKLGQRRAEIEAALAQPDIYADAQKDRLKSLLAEQSTVAAQLAAAEDRWLSLSSELETAGSAS
jgi:ATP-binding cassette subfamily F protein 3